MDRQRLEGRWVHTWATSHHALSIERVSTQFRDNLMRVKEYDKSITYDNPIKQ